MANMDVLINRLSESVDRRHDPSWRERKGITPGFLYKPNEECYPIPSRLKSSVVVGSVTSARSTLERCYHCGSTEIFKLTAACECEKCGATYEAYANVILMVKPKNRVRDFVVRLLRW